MLPAALKAFALRRRPVGQSAAALLKPERGKFSGKVAMKMVYAILKPLKAGMAPGSPTTS